MSFCDDAAVKYEMYALYSSVFPVGTSNHPRAMKYSIEWVLKQEKRCFKIVQTPQISEERPDTNDPSASENINCFFLACRIDAAKLVSLFTFHFLSYSFRLQIQLVEFES